MIDPQHDYEDERAAKARLRGTLREDCVGPCAACLAANVGQGADAKMLVPSSRVVNGQKQFIGRWLHGFELRAQLTTRRQLGERVRATTTEPALVER